MLDPAGLLAQLRGDEVGRLLMAIAMTIALVEVLKPLLAKGAVRPAAVPVGLMVYGLLTLSATVPALSWLGPALLTGLIATGAFKVTKDWALPALLTWMEKPARPAPKRKRSPAKNTPRAPATALPSEPI